MRMRMHAAHFAASKQQVQQHCQDLNDFCTIHKKHAHVCAFAHMMYVHTCTHASTHVHVCMHARAWDTHTHSCTHAHLAELSGVPVSAPAPHIGAFGPAAAMGSTVN